MSSRFRTLIYDPPERMAEVVGLAFVIVGCGIDFSTGTAYSPLIFYIPAVIYVAWFSSNRIGWAYIALIAISILAINSIGLDSTTNIGVAEFNALTRIATIGVVYWFVRRLRHEMLALRAANGRLRQLDVEKNKLFGVISHDLRTPFNAVLGYAELLERGTHDEDPDRVKRFARDCRDAARTAYDLLENLLQWARLQMNRIELVPALFEAVSVIDRCAKTLTAAAGLKNVEIVKEPVDPGLTCFADFAVAETILRNLLNNAIKFTPSGGRVTIAARAGDAFTEISVQDTGVGIARHRLDKLFALAAEPATAGTQGERGIGLGLALCKDLVERSGGRIAAESEVGRGSIFRFTLPRFGPGNAPPNSRRDRSPARVEAGG